MKAQFLVIEDFRSNFAVEKRGEKRSMKQEARD